MGDVMNFKTLALTTEQYDNIINILRTGFTGCRPSVGIAYALFVEGNLGIRISDVCRLRLKDIVRDGNRYRLDIKEIKTDKTRTFTVPDEIYNFLKIYTLEQGIKKDEKIFPMSIKLIQRKLALACDYLGYEGISTHSFRKYYATEIYVNNNYNIGLVRTLLQHSTSAVTQTYIGIGPKELETAIKNHVRLPKPI
jgi:integrase